LARWYGEPVEGREHGLGIGLLLQQEETTQLEGSSRQRLNDKLNKMERESVLRV
jgi:hypothetical protein